MPDVAIDVLPASLSTDVHILQLPADLRAGDLIAVPCLGVAARLSEVRAHCGR